MYNQGCSLFARPQNCGGVSVCDGAGDLIRTIIHDKNPGSVKINTDLDHIGHRRAASGTNWSN